MNKTIPSPYDVLVENSGQCIFQGHRLFSLSYLLKYENMHTFISLEVLGEKLAEANGLKG